MFIEDNEGYSLKNKVKNPFPSGYCPELDVSDKLGPELASHFMQLIGILHWAVKLGWVCYPKQELNPHIRLKTALLLKDIYDAGNKEKSH